MNGDGDDDEFSDIERVFFGAWRSAEGKLWAQTAIAWLQLLAGYIACR
jgi:hypothetical protein